MATEIPLPVVYLVRHGAATSKEENPQRPLSDHGRQAVERLARWAAATDVRPDAIVHSGKLRAEQTAEILGRRLHPSGGVNQRDGLGPDDDVQPVAEWLDECEGAVLLVGHLPFLGRLVSQLVIEDSSHPVVQFEPAALVALTCEDAHWSITRAVHAGLIP